MVVVDNVVALMATRSEVDLLPTNGTPTSLIGLQPLKAERLELTS